MSQTRPYRKDVNWIQGDTLSYSFTFNEDDSPLDLTGKDEITVILRNRNTTVFTHTLTGGELTITGTNKISGEASSETMDIATRSYDLIIFFDNDVKQTWVMFDVTIFDEHSELNSSASQWTIDIDTTSGTVEGQASQPLTKRSLLGYREVSGFISFNVDDNQFSWDGSLTFFPFSASNFNTSKLASDIDLTEIGFIFDDGVFPAISVKDSVDVGAVYFSFWGGKLVLDGFEDALSFYDTGWYEDVSESYAGYSLVLNPNGFTLTELDTDLYRIAQLSQFYFTLKIYPPSD